MHKMNENSFVEESAWKIVWGSSNFFYGFIFYIKIVYLNP